MATAISRLAQLAQPGVLDDRQALAMMLLHLVQDDRFKNLECLAGNSAKVLNVPLLAVCAWSTCKKQAHLHDQ